MRSSVLTVLCCNVTTCTWRDRYSSFGALENYLYSVALAFFDAIYLFSYNFNAVNITLSYRLFDGSIQTDFVDGTQTHCADFEVNPTFLLNIVELLVEQVHIEATLCAMF